MQRVLISMLLTVILSGMTPLQVMAQDVPYSTTQNASADSGTEAKTATIADALAQREMIAERGDYLYADVQAAAQNSEITSSDALAAALDVDPAMLVEAQVSGPQVARAAMQKFGAIQPQRGDSFAVLSTGVIHARTAEPGADLIEKGAADDQSTLELTLNVPEGATRLSFNYQFLSAEAPEFTQTAYNDTFTVRLVQTDKVQKDKAEKDKAEKDKAEKVVAISVSEADLHPVAATHTSGSSYNIFAATSSGVDTSFSSGLPDAGTTGVQRLSFDVTGGSEVQLTFTIADQGDGLLDSTVLLDNLTLSALDVVDPNPTFLANGQILTNPASLAQGGVAVVGAAADGVTQVLVRSHVSGPGTVRFCLSNGTAPADGGFSLLGSNTRTTCVTAPVSQISSGNFKAFAIYRVPDEFNRGTDESLGQREVTFNAAFTPNNGSPSSSQIAFKLVRPPVVLVHGLWGSGATWTFPLVTDSRFQVTLADYQSTNAAYFATNNMVTRSYIQQALTTMRQGNIAVTQVDVAGQSMGGVISRLHPQLPNYKKNTNFNEGDVNKLITLNSPHGGSPLASLAQRIRARSFWGGIVERLARSVGSPIDQGAIEDLALGSSALQAIEQTAIPSHAILGTGGTDLFNTFSDLSDLPDPFGGLYTILDWFYNADLFANQIHDGVVSVPSQRGGIASSATSTFSDEISLHTVVTDQPAHSDRLIELFNSPADSSLFAQFPSPADLVIAADALSLSPRVADGEQGQLIEGGLEIELPVTGASVTSSESIQLTVATQPDTDVNDVLLVGPGLALTDAAAPFNFDVAIPSDAVGTISLVAVGRDAEGNLYRAGDVRLEVQPNASLEAMTIAPRDTTIVGIGTSRSLSVFGQYSDNVVRNIQAAGAGTAYLTSNAKIVSVTDEGVLTTQGEGVATIIAQNGNLQDSIRVTVLASDPTDTDSTGGTGTQLYLPLMR